MWFIAAICRRSTASLEALQRLLVDCPRERAFCCYLPSYLHLELFTAHLGRRCHALLRFGLMVWLDRAGTICCLHQALLAEHMSMGLASYIAISLHKSPSALSLAQRKGWWKYLAAILSWCNSRVWGVFQVAQRPFKMHLSQMARGGDLLPSSRSVCHRVESRLCDASFKAEVLAWVRSTWTVWCHRPCCKSCYYNQWSLYHFLSVWTKRPEAQLSL